MSAHEAAAAVASASAAGYQMCRDGDLVRVAPAAAGTGRALVAWRRAGRELIVGAPHPVFDLSTLDQSLLVFEQTSARALVVSGTHRCASSMASGCDGTTGVCGGSGQPYPASDMAHVLGSAFDEAHRALAVANPDALVVSVHGAGLMGASISDGTTQATGADAPVARLAAELAQRLGGERISTCNAYPGAPDVEVRLCGTTNVQGRYLNGSADACGSAASSSSGRFLHVEQSTAVRSSPEALAAALGSIIPP